mmetsp:Transcript_91507/g.200542  ORF Transcript_91507/g.200542 Transcript_91507/m.200542 type:complete len:261 (-) Transcript_91507:154-936(-)
MSSGCDRFRCSCHLLKFSLSSRHRGSLAVRWRRWWLVRGLRWGWRGSVGGRCCCQGGGLGGQVHWVGGGGCCGRHEGGRGSCCSGRRSHGGHGEGACEESRVGGGSRHHPELGLEEGQAGSSSLVEPHPELEGISSAGHAIRIVDVHVVVGVVSERGRRGWGHHSLGGQGLWSAWRYWYGRRHNPSTTWCGLCTSSCRCPGRLLLGESRQSDSSLGVVAFRAADARSESSQLLSDELLQARLLDIRIAFHSAPNRWTLGR